MMVPNFSAERNLSAELAGKFAESWQHRYVFFLSFQFELAVMVANTICDDSLADKKKMILKIKTLFAFDLFCQNNKFKGIRIDFRIYPREGFLS
jgi:hypothetical protein